MVRHDVHAAVSHGAENAGGRSQRLSWAEAGSQVMRHDDPEVLSVRARRAIFGAFGCVFAAVAILRMTYGDVLFPLVFAVFAAVAFTLRWITGKWWAEMSPPPRWQRR